MDTSNPAVSSQIKVSPADLQEVIENKNYLPTQAKKMLLVQIAAIHDRLRDPNVGVGPRQAFADFLAKLADAYPKASVQGVAGNGVGFSVNIVLEAPSAKPPAITAEVTDVTPKAEPEAPKE